MTYGLLRWKRIGAEGKEVGVKGKRDRSSKTNRAMVLLATEWTPYKGKKLCQEWENEFIWDYVQLEMPSRQSGQPIKMSRRQLEIPE